MLKASTITVRLTPTTRTRINHLAKATRRSNAYVIEEALEQYLELNEWQVKGIETALEEADKVDAVWVDHDDLLARLEARVAG
ncbi:MAG: CopG family transcriptional regulator [Deltaproteobacteria bacterium HGW-Deltaproteobacteria-23]|nr:MAG: CopG family transcriptional regulator [Deltaproteobacteria bacterium HGW-Deltaproteobacteria-23]